MNLSKYILICDAVVGLMDPLVEIVIHNINTGCIIHINGKLSNRKAGDPSLIDSDKLDDVDQIIYPKLNFDGRLVKSISVKLSDKYLLCINCDVSIFSKMQELSRSFLSVHHQPESLFTNDWQEKLHITINTYLQNHKLSLDYASHRDKKALTKHLFELNAFTEKNAANYVAKSLGLSRATVFKYLKEWRNNGNF